MFIAVRNFMPKLKRNGIAGLRTERSLSSEEAWRKSQRFGGASFIIAGVILFIGNFLPLRGRRFTSSPEFWPFCLWRRALYTRKVSDRIRQAGPPFPAMSHAPEAGQDGM